MRLSQWPDSPFSGGPTAVSNHSIIARYYLYSIPFQLTLISHRDRASGHKPKWPIILLVYFSPR
jgi:hypothetical protein